MIRFRTLTQRFGALYAVVIAILVAVGAVVTVHLRGMRVDSQRLIEEGREQALVARLVTEVDTLLATLHDLASVDLEELHRARELLQVTREELAALEGDEHDPSREEHQEAEDRISDRLERNLAEADALLARGAAEDHGEARRLLERSRHFAEVLLHEARREGHEINRDLQNRARATRSIVALTWIAAALLLGAALVLVHRGVVRPIRRLRAGAERFGQGERDHRISVESRDEIGDLALSFNQMADRLAHAQETLEERVRQRTSEFLRAARLADLGLLASGIAHEINTPLASIASSAEGLERRTRNGEASPEVLREYASVISGEAYRAREITTRMLALVREEPGAVSRVGLRLVVDQALQALRHRAQRAAVTLEACPVDEAWVVSVNPGELVQILVNLLANAIDASPAGASVRLEAHERDGRLHLSVADRGAGIRDEDRERIFEPFFTTKSAREGTGLGLALVATMVESHGGFISVESEPGSGSTFRVDLPTDWSPPA